MTREALANAFDKAAEAFAELAHELRANEPSVARADVASSVPTGAPERAGVAPSAPAPSTALGVCPKHRVAWAVKEGGISKNGKPYKAFWKCNEKDASAERGYCQERPEPGWARTHSAEEAAMEAMDVPF
jgi:hypothetical protein